MEDDVKKDLPTESKVEEINVKVDASEIKEAIEELGRKLTPPEPEIPGPAAVVVSEEEKKIKQIYCIKDAILKFADPRSKWDGLEKEMHDEGVKENKDAGVGTTSYEGFLVPTMLNAKEAEVRATLQATVDAAGGYAVAEDMLGLIGTLRNSMVTAQAGMRILSGLQGTIAIPRRSADSVAYWRSEGGVATQSDPTYEQVTLAPNRLTSFTRFSRQFLRQSSFSVEVEVRDVLNYAMRNELEQTAFDGSGSSNQPEGIFNNSSVNNADHGSNGTLINWANIVNMEGMVAADNALAGRLSYITNSTMGAYMKTLVKTTNQGGFLWENFTPLAGGAGMVNGYEARISNVLSNALTKGTGTGLSPIIFGDWTALLLGVWGAQEFIVDPYTRAAYDEINVTTVGYFDYALRHPEAFSTIEAGRTS